MFALIAIWALAEATFFFIVVDVPIMALGVQAGVRRALVGAVFAAVIAAIGGCGLYFWSNANPESVFEVMVAIPAVDKMLLTEVYQDWLANGFLSMLVGSFSGVPYKLYAYSAGAAPGSQGQIALAGFFFASVLARLPRFALVALVAGWTGPRMLKHFGPRRVWFAFALGWVGFYALYWKVMGF